MSDNLTIVGAGMAGCLAGYVFPNARIIEAGSKIKEHQAVLRFRDESVSQLTGIPFKKVKVVKGIWFGNGFTTPNPAVCNLYSDKVIGKYMARSISNIDTVERYIAPSNFQSLLLESMRDRIEWNTPLTTERVFTLSEKYISTMPLPKMMDVVSRPYSQDFEFRNIVTFRCVVHDSDSYCTVYYPDPNISIYRATLTGQDLIVESRSHILTTDEVSIVFTSLGVKSLGVSIQTLKVPVHSKYGKIAPHPNSRNYVYELTRDHGIYSVGRYATWRNILLDDVVKDLRSIRNMLQFNNYQQMLRTSK